MTPALAADADGSLARIGGDPGPALAACQDRLRLRQERPPTWAASATWAAIPRRSLGAAKPPAGGTLSLADRRRLVSLDRWPRWGRLTPDRTWVGPQGATRDGTTNACERAIGWGGKERSRRMRGDQRPASIRNLSRLIAALGHALAGPGFALADVIT